MGIVLAVLIFRIIVNWRIFAKAGEPGWKCIIPFYSDYTLFKITWEPKFFWVYLALTFGGGLVSGILEIVSEVIISEGNMSFTAAAVILLLLLIAIFIALLVIVVKQTHKMSKSFGHDVGFTIGLIFLAPIFLAILAFGKSEYKGADL